MKRRIFSVLTALALVLSLLPAPALAEENVRTVSNLEELKTAFSDASGGGTVSVQLGTDISGYSISLSGGSLTLDANGHTLSSSNSTETAGIIEVTGGTFTLTGSGTIKSSGRISGILVKENGAVNINGGTVEGGDTTSRTINLTGGSLEVNGGTIKNSKDRTGYAIYSEGGSVTVGGGTIEAVYCGIRINNPGSSLIVCGGADISGSKDSGIDISKAKDVQIQGGSIKSDAFGLYIGGNFSGSIALSGGSFSGGSKTISSQSSGAATIGGMLKKADKSSGDHWVYKNADGAVIREGLDGLDLSGPVTVGKCDGLVSFSPNSDGTHTGTCSACGLTNKADCTYGEYTSDDSTHSKACTVCGWTVSGAHTWVDGVCSVCKAQFTAVAQVNGVNYADLQKAFDAAAQIEGGGTVTLLKNVTVDKAVKLTSGTVTLDGQGTYTLTGTDVYTLNVTGGTLTLENVTVENNTGSSWGINAPSAMPAPPPNITIGDTTTVSGLSGGIVQTTGSLTVNGTVKGTGPSGKGISAMNMTLTINEGAVISGGSGDNAAGISQDGGTLTVNGGTISGHVGLSVEASFGNPTVRLTGGTFTGSSGDAIVATGPSDAPRPLSGLLDSGYTIYKADGTALTTEELASDRTGSGTFTVGCAHASVDSVTASDPENGVVTVTATCTKCNERVTLGTLTMVGSGQTVIFGNEASYFEVKPSAGLTAACQWTGNDFAEANDPTTARVTPVVTLDAVLKSSELEFPCAVTVTPPGGVSATVTLTFTLNVEPMDISNAEISFYPDIKNVTYDGQEHGSGVTGVVLDPIPMPLPTEYFDIQLVDASGEAAKRTDAGTYQIRLTGKYPFTGVKTLESPSFTIEKEKPAIAWGENVEEHWEYTGKPVAPSLTPTVTLVEGETYSEETHGKITYSYATEETGTYTEGLPTEVGTYYIKAALPEQKNYTAAETGTETGTLTLFIQKATTTVTAPTTKALTYNGKPQALVTAAVASAGEVQYSLTGADGPWSKAIPTAVNAGEYEVWYKVDETENYTGVAAQSVTATIEKAEVTAASQNLLVKNDLAKDYTLDLSTLLPALPKGQEYGELEYGNVRIANIGETNEAYKAYFDFDSVTLKDSVLTVSVKKVESGEQKELAEIQVRVTSRNFENMDFLIKVSSTNKTPVAITGVEAANWTYDGTAHPGYSGTPSAGEYTGKLDEAYHKGGEKLDGRPKDAGTYRVTLSVPTENQEYEGSRELAFTVEQAQVTVKADDQTATVGDEMPDLTWRVVSGLASGETLKTDPVPACDPDMSKAGTYPITISGGAVPDGGNYKAEIVYQNGTLTVEEKSAPPKPVDPDPGPDEPDPPVDPGQVETKTEVKEGISQVPEGLKDIPALGAPYKLEAAMRTSVTQTGVPAQNTAVYDVKLMVSKDGGQTWTPATKENFPSDGKLTVTLPYPAGTDSSYTFTVIHMFTTADFGKIPGHTESPAVTNTEQGLRFTVTGLSPISVGWKAKITGTGGSSSGGSSSGGGSRPMASVTVEQAEHGKVTSDRSSAGSGSPVTLTVQPDRGYRLESLTVTDSRGNELQLTARSGGKYAFTMPGGNVTVKAVFAPLADSGACDGGAACPSRAFTDLKSGAWYHEAVDFVLRNGLMNGYGNGLFGPESRLSRAQFAQILYNKEGRPAGAGSAPFTDVAPDAWCAPAVAWAAERGIAGGYGNGTFGPNDAITREQLAVMLWRYAGSPAAPGGELSFMDAEQIGTYAREALRWAVQTGVMNGKAGGVLDPKGLATRAHAAQILKNFLEQG